MEVIPENEEADQCRCCLEKKGQRIELWGEYYCDGERENYGEMLSECFSLGRHEPNDTEVICLECLENLRNAFKFRKKVLTSNMIQPRQTDDNVMAEFPDSADQCASPALDYPEGMPKLAGIPRIAVNTKKRRTGSADGIPKATKPTAANQKPVPTTDKKPVKINQKSPPKQTASKSAEEVRVRKRKCAAGLEAKRAHEANVRTLIQHSNCTLFLSRTVAGIQCCYCEAYLLNLTLLREHMQSTHSKDQYRGNKPVQLVCKMDITDLKCNLCEQNFELLSSLKEHLISEHDVEFVPEEKNYVLEFKLTDASEAMTCALCSYTCEAFRTLVAHMSGHYQNYLCEECDMGFVNEHRLMMHQKTHRTGTFKCSVCPKVFSTSLRLAYHENVSHKDPNVTRSEQKCPLCEKTFASYYVMKRHVVDDHKSSATTYKCTTCDKVFVLKRDLSHHIRRVHLVEKDHKCSECGRGFFTNIELNKHMVQHNGRRSHKCSECGIGFFTKIQLRKHMAKSIRHNGGKVFQCVSVPKHILEDQNAATYKCSMCDKMYILKKDLSNHIRRVHLLERNHKCSECGMGFCTKNELKKHMVRHNAEKIHKCTECNKPYSRLDALKTHMRIHRNDRRLKCELCAATFLRKSALKSHMVFTHQVSAVTATKGGNDTRYYNCTVSEVLKLVY